MPNAREKHVKVNLLSKSLFEETELFVWPAASEDNPLELVPQSLSPVGISRKKNTAGTKRPATGDGEGSNPENFFSNK